MPTLFVTQLSNSSSSSPPPPPLLPASTYASCLSTCAVQPGWHRAYVAPPRVHQRAPADVTADTQHSACRQRHPPVSLVCVCVCMCVCVCTCVYKDTNTHTHTLQATIFSNTCNGHSVIRQCLYVDVCAQCDQQRHTSSQSQAPWVPIVLLNTNTKNSSSSFCFLTPTHTHTHTHTP